MPKDRYNGSQFLNLWLKIIHWGSHITLARLIKHWIISYLLRKKVIEYLLCQYRGTVIPIFRISFYKRPAIDITDIRFPLHSQ